ncbi:MAG: polysaccharide pyruvyl transferase family protein [Acidimicrobiales bacterium]
MSGGHPLIEHWGTFELANFGDLLYPLVLEQHLSRALPAARTQLVGPIGGDAPMGLDRPVRRAVRHDEGGFWGQVADVDAIVVGGGDLIHSLTGVATRDSRPHRLDSWTFAVRSSLLAEVRPLVWNALGVPFDVPDELAHELRAACAHVGLLAVRDEASRRRLEAAGVEREIRVVPDTGALVDGVFGAADRAAAVDQLRASGALPPPGRPMAVLHVSFASPATIAELAGAVREGCRDHPGAALVLLEVGATHGDRGTLRALADQLGTRSWVVQDPTVLEIAAVLDAADVVVTSSFHGLLVASVLGTASVGFLQHDYRPSKLAGLVRSLDREDWLVDRPSVVAGALDAALAGGGKPDAARVEVMRAGAGRHLEALCEHLSEAARPSIDLAERDAAHRHLLTRLEAARSREDRLHADLHVVDLHLRSARAAARTWEAAFWRAQARAGRSPAPEAVIDLAQLDSAELEPDPDRSGVLGPLFAPEVAAALEGTFPLDEAEQRDGSDAGRSWRYRIRCLLPIGSATPVRPHALAPAWRQLADELAGTSYRAALTRLTGVDLTDLDLEVNAFSFGRGAHQEPHPDLPETVVTHVIWFNEVWDEDFGGTLRILRSHDPDEVAQALLLPLGWSAVFVGPAGAWRGVTPVTEAAPDERRALVATFHRPGSASSLWADAPD